MGDMTMGSQARLMSQAMRRLTSVVSKTQCVCIFTNQIREKIGVMFGNPETTSGGRALKFFSSIRIDIRRKDQIKTPEGNGVGGRGLDPHRFHRPHASEAWLSRRGRAKRVAGIMDDARPIERRQRGLDFEKI